MVTVKGMRKYLKKKVDGKESFYCDVQISAKGKDFCGVKLNEDSFEKGFFVIHEGDSYEIGNIGHGLVELCTGGFRMKTVKISSVSLLNFYLLA